MKSKAARRRRAKMDKDRRERLKALGLCVACKSPRGPDGTSNHCRPCAVHHTKMVVARQNELREAGTCVRCRTRPIENVGGRYCSDCLKAMADRRIRRQTPSVEIPATDDRHRVESLRLHDRGKTCGRMTAGHNRCGEPAVAVVASWTMRVLPENHRCTAAVTRYWVRRPVCRRHLHMWAVEWGLENDPLVTESEATR